MSAPGCLVTWIAASLALSPLIGRWLKAASQSQSAPSRDGQKERM